MNEQQQLRFLLGKTAPLTEEAAERMEQWIRQAGWLLRRRIRKELRHSNFKTLDPDSFQSFYNALDNLLVTLKKKEKAEKLLETKK